MSCQNALVEQHAAWGARRLWPPTVPTPPSVLSIYSNWQPTKYAGRRLPWRGAAASAPSEALAPRTTAAASPGCHPELPHTPNNKISETHTILP